MKYLTIFALAACGLATWAYSTEPEKYPHGLAVLAFFWGAAFIGIGLASMPDPQPDTPEPAPEPPRQEVRDGA